MKKTLSFILAAIMIVMSLVGCTKKVEKPEGALTFDEVAVLIEEKVPKSEIDNIIVMTVGDYELTLAEFRYYYLNYALQFPQFYGFDWKEDETRKKEFEEYLTEALKMCSVVEQISAEKNAYLTNDDLNNGPFATYDSLGQMYGENVDTVLHDDFFVSPYFMVLYEAYLNLYNKFFDLLYVNGEKFEEIKEKTIQHFKDNDYIRATHILLSFPTNEDGSDATDEQKAEVFKKAQEVLDKINAGTDFNELVAQYNEDPGLTEAGYYFGKGTMVEPFETAAYALEEGEVSGIVESPFGYHIIKRLSFDDDSIATSDNFVNFAFTDFQELINGKLEKTEIKLKDNFNDLIQTVLDEEVTLVAELKAQYDEMNKKAEEEASEENKEETSAQDENN